MLSEFAPAKINLHLHVVGRRDDGYHLLDSLVAFAGIGDRLSVTPADELSLSVVGPFAAALQAETDNLVLRAARAVAAQAGIEATGRMVLEKNLPVASGIGGGSADAAAALRLLCRFWRLEFPAGMLDQLAVRLGADVPVCIASRPTMMSGIGETLAPAPKLPQVGIVLVNPGIAVSTPAVFRSRPSSFSLPAQFPEEGWQDVDALVASLHATRNDLELSAWTLAPPIGDALAALSAVPECLMSRMSGSGATCFGLFASAGAACEAAVGMRRAGWWVWGGGIEG